MSYYFLDRYRKQTLIFQAYEQCIHVPVSLPSHRGLITCTQTQSITSVWVIENMIVLVTDM